VGTAPMVVAARTGSAHAGKAVEDLPFAVPGANVVGAIVRQRSADGWPDGLDRHRLWTSNIPPDLLARLGVRPRAPERHEPVLDTESPGAELLDRLQLYDLETSLAEGLLTKADRAGTMSSLDLRAPFLDRDVMEIAAGLTREQRIHGWVTKAFLKRYARRYLPRPIVDRRKRGLSVPLAGWLRGPLCEWAREKLSCRFFPAAGVNPRAVLELFEEHRLRRADHARALWTLLVLSQWLEWVAAPRLVARGGREGAALSSRSQAGGLYLP